MEIRQVYSPVFINKPTPRDYAAELGFMSGGEDKIVILNSDESIKKLYADPTVQMNAFIYERVVKVEDDKLILKINKFIKIRRIGRKYFKKRFQSSYLKFDLKTGNFLTVEANGTSRKNRESKLRVNNFFELKDFCQSSNFFRVNDTVVGELRGDFASKDPFDDQPIFELLKEYVGISIPKQVTNKTVSWLGIYDYVRNYEADLFAELCEKFIKLKGIKTPNGEYNDLLCDFYPTEKYLKKNDRKLILSILDMLGLKSKYSNKILHQYMNIDIGYYGVIHKLLGGVKYMGDINPKVYETITCNVGWHHHSRTSKFLYPRLLDFECDLSPLEKINFVKLLNSFVSNDEIKSHGTVGIIELIDHFKMLKTIREVDPTMMMKATTLSEFTEEHKSLSVMLRYIRKGTVVTYKFDEEMVSSVEEPIHIEGKGTFYPYILKNENEYYEEGQKMHHCVGGYYNKDRSVIISLRTKEDERVTCEYTADKGINVQSKYFCNKQPPEEFSIAILTVLNGRCYEWAKKNKLKSIEMVEEPLVINGKVVKEKLNHIPTLELMSPF